MSFSLACTRPARAAARSPNSAHPTNITTHKLDHRNSAHPTSGTVTEFCAPDKHYGEAERAAGVRTDSRHGHRILLTRRKLLQGYLARDHNRSLGIGIL